MAFTERYVRADAAGGADGTNDTTDGTTGAFTLAEMLTDEALGRTGYRYNIRGGTYARTTSAIALTGSASSAAPNMIRGFISSPGDIVRRSSPAAAAHSTGSWPKITFTTVGFTNGANTILEGLYIERASNGNVLTTPGGSIVRSCVAYNSGTSGNYYVMYSTTAFSDFIDCDAYHASASPSPVCFFAYRSNVYGCRAWSTDGVGTAYMLDYVGAVSRSVAIKTANGVNGQGGCIRVDNCSFYDLRGDHIVHTSGGQVQAANNVAWGGTGSRWWGADAVRGGAQHNNAIGNMTSGDANEGDYPVEGEVALTANPFESATDLSLNTDSGGGAECVGAALHSNLDIGAAQSAATASGARFSIARPLMGDLSTKYK